QAELADMRDGYVRLFDFAPVGYMTLDVGGNVLNANLTLTGLLQADRRFLVGRPFSLFLGAQEQAVFTEHQREVLKNGEQRSFELSIRRSDNSYFRAQVEISALIDQSALATQSGRATQSALETQSALVTESAEERPETEKNLLVALSDVTQRWQAEREIRENERRLHYVLENLPAMLVAMDRQGQIVAWNAECEAVTGYHAGDIVGNPRAFTLLVPQPEDRQKLVEMLSDNQANINDHELTLISRDGIQKTIAWSNRTGRFPIPGWGSWAVGWDITDEVAWRKEQREQRNQLEVEVAERTRQLDRLVEQLREEIEVRQQSEDSLKRSNRLSTQLAKAATRLQEAVEIPKMVEVLNAEFEDLGLSCALSLIDPKTFKSSYFTSFMNPDEQDALSELLGYDLASYQPIEKLWEVFSRRQMVTRADLDRLMRRAFPDMCEHERFRVYELIGYTP
ncbi:MAG: PAS domain S-box protein, partial [Anaerolineales bacterium]